MLLGSRNIMALRKILNDLFSRPATWEKSCLGIGKAPFDIGNESIVGARSTEMVRILKVEGFIGSAYEDTISRYRLQCNEDTLPKRGAPLPLSLIGWSFLPAVGDARTDERKSPINAKL